MCRDGVPAQLWSRPGCSGAAPQTLATAVRAQAVAVLALAPIAVVAAGNIAHAAWDVGAMSALVALAVPVALVFSVRALMRVGTVAGGGFDARRDRRVLRGFGAAVELEHSAFRPGDPHLERWRPSACRR